MGTQPPTQARPQSMRPPIQAQPQPMQPPIQQQPMGMQPPIQQQPMGMRPRKPLPPFMQPPPPPPNCPPGLEYIAAVDTLIVHQMIEPFEIATGIETNNRYMILNSMGMPIYMAAENSSGLCLQNGGADREFTIDILDGVGRPLIRLYRPYLCCGGCCCGGHTVFVEAPMGNRIAMVQQRSAGLDILLLPEMQLVGICEAPHCCDTWGSLLTRTFLVRSGDATQTEIGRISKLPNSYFQEVFTDADTFQCCFHMGLEPRAKVGILAATFLLDFIAYETPADEQ